LIKCLKKNPSQTIKISILNALYCGKLRKDINGYEYLTSV